MGVLKRAVWALPYKSLMYTVRDHSTKLERHLSQGGSLETTSGPFGSAEVYAARLEKEFFKIRDMARMDLISSDQFQAAEDCVRRAFELYRAIKHGELGRG